MTLFELYQSLKDHMEINSENLKDKEVLILIPGDDEGIPIGQVVYDAATSCHYLITK